MKKKSKKWTQSKQFRTNTHAQNVESSSICIWITHFYLCSTVCLLKVWFSVCSPHVAINRGKIKRDSIRVAHLYFLCSPTEYRLYKLLSSVFLIICYEAYIDSNRNLPVERVQGQDPSQEKKLSYKISSQQSLQITTELPLSLYHHYHYHHRHQLVATLRQNLDE